MSTFTVITNHDEDIIIQRVMHSDLHQRTSEISRSLINTRDEQIRNALIEMGWTPPSDVATLQFHVNETPDGHMDLISGEIWYDK